MASGRPVTPVGPLDGVRVEKVLNLSSLPRDSVKAEDGDCVVRSINFVLGPLLEPFALVVDLVIPMVGVDRIGVAGLE